MKLWGGRFAKKTDYLVEDFHSSISFDQRLYRQDIQGSIAHARMLGKQGIITIEEADQLARALESIQQDIEAGLVTFEVDAEDIHMNIEKILTERVGEAGKKLHTARSRNDQVALDIRLYLKEEIKEVARLLVALQKVMLDLADQHLTTVMPGYTHLQKAQPITFAHHLMAYFQMFTRDIERLQDCFKRVDVMPLGSGALAGTTFPIDRNYVREQLGFAGITMNSLDGVSDRDFAVEFCGAASLIMMHLSRFSEEIVLWSSNEFRFITLDDGFSTGSSIMPQKKNPDVAELVRGKTGRVYGDLMGLLTVLKGLPLAYNKDMQEDKEALFDAVDTVKKCLLVFAPMIKTMKVNKQVMRSGVTGGFINATDAADYLAAKNVPFREAHEIVGKMVLCCEQKGKSLEELTFEEMKEFSPVFEEDIYEKISPEKCVEARNVPGGPAPQAVSAAINLGREALAKILVWL
ncbi:argininosuccinate lyase [Dehalobacterium formicoaceticum]|uniref:Argininosuccinate lyase n=1 Tax=Dehalobacterium formicoaceticum TaxID=51515 RepID=A0ABT1XZH8_9FIRM|nr:argininosuccinate lyase [Dehalobacterium formicoaceticum]MCR6544019.1 argininosuccinate lyase [Dehalobacterium formicoaceticum]